MEKLRTNDLVEQYIETKNPDAFTELISRHSRIIYSAISKFEGLKFHEKEDVYQDSVLRILESIPRFNMESSKFSTWVYSCAKNASMHQISENKKRGFLLKPTQLNNGDSMSFLEKKGPTVENMWDNDTFLDCKELENARLKLTEDENQLLTWAYDRKISYPDIGKKLGKSRQAVYSSLVKIYKKLRNLLEGRL